MSTIVISRRCYRVTLVHVYYLMDCEKQLNEKCNELLESNEQIVESQVFINKPSPTSCSIISTPFLDGLCNISNCESNRLGTNAKNSGNAIVG
jgi:hypothetical protein